MAVRKTTLWLSSLSVVLLAALFIYFTKPENVQAVRVVEVKQEPLVSSLSTNGKVEPTDSSELRATQAGFVKKILVKEGDAVRKGQLLMELGRTQEAAEAAKARAELEAAQAELATIERGGTAAEIHENERRLQAARAARNEAEHILTANERLLAKNAIPRLEVDESREKLRQAERDLAYQEQLARRRYNEDDKKRAVARLESARAAAAYAQQQLGSTTVTAPVSGTVYSVPVKEGNFVPTGELLARVGNLNRVRVRTYVDEPELGRLAPGLEVNVHWDALPAQLWTGTVERVPAEVTMLGTRSVGQVICTIDNKDRKLLANVNVDVEVIFQRRASTLTVPKEAVVHLTGTRRHTGDDQFVFVIDKDKDVVHRRAVKVGASNATRYEILSGLQAGDKVAIPGDRPLADGTKIKELA